MFAGSQTAETGPDKGAHDEVRPPSDGGGPARGSLATEAAAGTLGGVVAGSLVGWGSAGIAAAGAWVALTLSAASPEFERVKAAADADDRSVPSWIRWVGDRTLKSERS